LISVFQELVFSIKEIWCFGGGCFYYESRKRELQTKPIYECRCDERLKTKSEKSTRLSCSGMCVYYESIKQCSDAWPVTKKRRKEKRFFFSIFLFSKILGLQNAKNFTENENKQPSMKQSV
jgi:hypothetical protein